MWCFLTYYFLISTYLIQFQDKQNNQVCLHFSISFSLFTFLIFTLSFSLSLSRLSTNLFTPSNSYTENSSNSSHIQTCIKDLPIKLKKIVSYSNFRPKFTQKIQVSSPTFKPSFVFYPENPSFFIHLQTFILFQIFFRHSSKKYIYIQNSSNLFFLPFFSQTRKP